MSERTFDHLLLLGRPAAGKSEFTDFIKKIPSPDRAQLFHIGRFDEIDDFPWIWEKFMEDDMWEEAGFPRIFSVRNGNQYDVRPEMSRLYKLMFVKFNHSIADRYLSRPNYYKDNTLIVEFSRGCEHTYEDSLSRLSREVLEKAAILYFKVDFDESWRRNVARYQEKLKSSILAHMLPRNAMEMYYMTDDWAEITHGQADGLLCINGIKVPFATMENEPELPPGPDIAKRYTESMERLWCRYSKGDGK
ncbi:MAG: hypothetical protein V2A66_01940 [Pseudomonadota bacterium]